MVEARCTIARLHDLLDDGGQRRVEWLIRRKGGRSDRQVAAALTELSDMRVHSEVVAQHRRGRCVCPEPDADYVESGSP